MDYSLLIHHCSSSDRDREKARGVESREYNDQLCLQPREKEREKERERGERERERREREERERERERVGQS
jgi:hypothetical protein